MRSIRPIQILFVLTGKLMEVVRVFRPGLVILFAIGSVLTTMAQSQIDTSWSKPSTRSERRALRREERQWSRQKRKMKPLEFKSLVEARDKGQFDVAKYKVIIDKVNTELSNRLAEISALKAENARQKATIDSLYIASRTSKKGLKNSKAEQPAAAANNYQSGTNSNPTRRTYSTNNLSGTVATGTGPNASAKTNGNNTAGGISGSNQPGGGNTGNGSSEGNVASNARNGQGGNNYGKQSVTGSGSSRGTASGSKANLADANINPLPEGVVFKVQIGAFRNRNLQKYLNNSRNFTGETDPDGLRKYTLGYFQDYWEADNFKRYMREMGVHDAWIVSYKDGRRVPIKDVLENALSLNNRNIGTLANDWLLCDVL